MDLNEEQRRNLARNSGTAGAQMLVEMWPLFLDGIEGMVEQTKARGFTEAQAREIVVSVFTSKGK